VPGRVRRLLRQRADKMPEAPVRPGSNAEDD